MEVLKQTLNEMNFVFSSNEFSKQAIKNGLNQEAVKRGIIAVFLHKNAKQMGSKRMWQKKSNKVNVINFNEDEITKSIKLLKSNGYKILKPISDWLEL